MRSTERALPSESERPLTVEVATTTTHLWRTNDLG